MTNCRICATTLFVTSLLISASCSDADRSPTSATADSPVNEPTTMNAKEKVSADGNAPTTQATTERTAEVPSGDVIYAHYCGHCHNDGDGHPGTMRLAIRLSPAQSVIQQRENLPAAYIKQVVRNGLGMMPAFRPTEISDNELNTLAAFIAQP